MPDATITEVLLDDVFVDTVLPGPPPVDFTSGDATITEGIDMVFAEAGSGGTTQQSPFPWPIAIDGRPFEIDLAQYTYEMPDGLRQAIDYSASPGEQSFDVGGAWLRTIGDWSLGAGQPYLDTKTSLQRMFNTSLGLDVWTKRRLALLPDTEMPTAFIAASATLKLLPLGVYLYFMDGEGHSLARTSGPYVTGPALTPITGGPGANLVDLTTDGTKIYLATATGIYTHDPSGTTMAVYGGAASTTVAQRIAYANGFLFCAVGHTISTIDAGGALTTQFTHFNQSFTWAAILGTPSRVYAGGQGSDLSEIYRFEINPATGGLLPAVLAGTLPRGEYLRSMTYYSGTVLIGTSKGLRLALVDAQGSGDLAIGPLIETTTDVLCGYGDAEFVWFGWTGYDDFHTGVGRAKLSEFTFDTKPAYASDLMAAQTSGPVTSVCRFQGHTYFAVGGSGFWREVSTGKTVDTGVLTTGKMEWGTFEPKTFLGTELITDPLVGSIRVDLFDDQDFDFPVGAHSNQGATGLGRTLGAGIGDLSTFFELALTFTRSSDPTLPADTTPVLRHMSARAIPVPRQIQRWGIPIVCREHVAIGKGHDIDASIDVAAAREFFVTLRREARAVMYQEGDRQHLVLVRRVWIPAGAADRWGTNMHGIQCTLMVQLDSASDS